jgi:hypothetical protein
LRRTTDSATAQVDRKESIAMNRTRFEYVAFGFAVILLGFAPASVRGQAGDDVILVEAIAPDFDEYRPGRFRRGEATRQILTLMGRMRRDLKEFAVSTDELAEQLLALEQAAEGAAGEEGNQDDVEVPKPIYLKFPLDEQGEVLRDASRTLYDLADSLEERGLRLRAESLRKVAEEMRDDSCRPCKDDLPRIGWFTGPIVTLDDWGTEFNERWERLPEPLRPRKDSGFDPLGR